MLTDNYFSVVAGWYWLQSHARAMFNTKCMPLVIAFWTDHNTLLLHERCRMRRPFSARQHRFIAYARSAAHALRLALLDPFRQLGAGLLERAAMVTHLLGCAPGLPAGGEGVGEPCFICGELFLFGPDAGDMPEHLPQP